jgi:hypothetical protein
MDASRNAGFAIIAYGDDGGEPTLLARETPDGEVVELNYTEWAQKGSGGLMAALARTVFRDHPYLLGGVQ